MNDTHNELLSSGEELLTRIDDAGRSRAAARKAADRDAKGRIIKSRTLPDLIDELERKLTAIADRLAGLESRRVAGPQVDLQGFVNGTVRVIRNFVLEESKKRDSKIEALTERLEALELRLTALSSNARRGIQ